MAEASKRRVRKVTDVYVPESSSASGAKTEKDSSAPVPVGKGARLADLPNVVSNFGSVTFSNPHLKMLHFIALGVGKKREFKSNLLSFSGLIIPEGEKEAEAARDKVRIKIMKLQVNDLKSVMDLADVERGSESFGGKNPTKEMLRDRLMEWLEEPRDSGRGLRKMRALKGAAKGGRVSGGGGSVASSGAKKRKSSGGGGGDAGSSSDKEKEPRKEKKTKSSGSGGGDDGSSSDKEKEPRKEKKTKSSGGGGGDGGSSSDKEKESRKEKKRKSGGGGGGEGGLSSDKEKEPRKEKKRKSSGASGGAAMMEDKSAEVPAIQFDIPGASLDQVRAKVKSIVNSANKEELTVKGVRKLLEDWLDADLKFHKDAVRSLVMEAMDEAD